MVTQFEDVFSSKKSRPMLEPPTDKNLFLPPRHDMLSDIIEKILLDGAQGILVLLVWKNSPQFWSVGKIAVDWWDCPAEMPTCTGAKPSWTTRIVLFDALAALEADAGVDKRAGVREEEFSDSSASAPPTPEISVNTHSGAQTLPIVETEPHTDGRGRRLGSGAQKMCRQMRGCMHRESFKDAEFTSFPCNDTEYCSRDQGITSEAASTRSLIVIQVCNYLLV